jgi:hypothetical protein
MRLLEIESSLQQRSSEAAVERTHQSRTTRCDACCSANLFRWTIPSSDELLVTHRKIRTHAPRTTSRRDRTDRYDDSHICQPTNTRHVSTVPQRQRQQRSPWQCARASRVAARTARDRCGTPRETSAQRLSAHTSVNNSNRIQSPGVMNVSQSVFITRSYCSRNNESLSSRKSIDLRNP